MDWSCKPSIASYFLRTGMGKVPLTGYDLSPEVRDGVKLKKDIGVSSLQNLLQLYSKIAADYFAKSNPKKAIAILRRALNEVDLRAAEAPPSGPEQKGGVHEAEDVLLGKIKVRQQLCATFSRQGQHHDALIEVKKALGDIDQIWKDVCRTSDIQVEEMSVLELFSNPLNVEEMLLAYPVDWLEQAVSVTVQAKHCLAIELEFIQKELDDEEKAKGWEKINALHEEAHNLATEVLIPSHPVRKLAESTRSQALHRHSLTNCSKARALENEFSMPAEDKVDKDNVGKKGKEGEDSKTANVASKAQKNQEEEKPRREKPKSPTEASPRRRRPVKKSPPMVPSRSTPSFSKNPFQDFFDSDATSVDTIRRQLLIRNETCVREFHGKLKRNQTRFHEWMDSSHHDDLFELRTVYNDSGIRTMRRHEKKKALSEGRPFTDEIDLKGPVKTVKGIKKNLISSNTDLCRRAGVYQEDPNAPAIKNAPFTLALAGALKGNKAREDAERRDSAITQLGGHFAAIGGKRSSKARGSQRSSNLFTQDEGPGGGGGLLAGLSKALG